MGPNRVQRFEVAGRQDDLRVFVKKSYLEVLLGFCIWNMWPGGVGVEVARNGKSVFVFPLILAKFLRHKMNFSAGGFSLVRFPFRYVESSAVALPKPSAVAAKPERGYLHDRRGVKAGRTFGRSSAGMPVFSCFEWLFEANATER